MTETSWREATSLFPDLSNSNGWALPEYYETIHLFHLGNDIYIVARGAQGLFTLRIQQRQWSVCPPIIGDFADTHGWNRPSSYKTILPFVANHKAYLVARTPGGLLTLRFNDMRQRWAAIPGMGILRTLSDAEGWALPEHYETIQVAVVGANAYLIARAARGLLTYVYSDGRGWVEAADPIADFSNAAGWASPQYYRSLRALAVGAHLYLIARGAQGLVTLRLQGDQWEQAAAPLGDLADSHGWHLPCYAQTIMPFALGDQAYLLTRHGDGLLTYRLARTKWVPAGPLLASFTDAAGWRHAEYYRTLRVVVVPNGTAFLVARGVHGVQLLRFELTADSVRWVPATKPLESTSDAQGGHLAYHARSIRALATEAAIYLVTRGRDGLATHKVPSV